MIAFVHLHPPPSVVAVDKQYRNCRKPFHCANVMDIGYPFWAPDRPEYCGFPGFKLNCSGEAPEITIRSETYRVLRIDNVSQTLTVARTDYWDTICPAKLANTTLNLTIFSYASNNQNLTIYYGCSSIPSLYSDTVGLSREFNCIANYTDDDDDVGGYYLTTNLTSSTPLGVADAINNTLESCDNSVIVTGKQSAIQSLQSNLTSGNLITALRDGFELRWHAEDTLCNTCRSSGGLCGYNQATSEFNCYCPDHHSASACPTIKEFSPPGATLEQWMKAVGIAAFGGAMVLSIVVICRYKGAILCWKKFIKNDENVDACIRNYGSLAPKRYTYSDVKKMTNSFADIVGRGGYGTVYKGKLSDGHLVAVKVLNEYKSSGEEFINEVASMSRTSHVNIVTLLGFCHERTKRALIYEFVPNGSLDKFIYDEGTLRTHPNLDCIKLYQIAIGIARGLEYLHQGCNTRIVHFDIKPHNILLDEDFCPKISDFGLAKLCRQKESIISMFGARGTAGYIAPEVFSRSFGGVSHKSDVYSYGMMVLEMVGGRKNIDITASQSSELYFPHWIYNQLEPGEHLRLHRDIGEEEEEKARKMIMVGLWCIQTNPSDRPSMTKVVEMLEGPLESLHIAPMPFLSCPRESPENLYSTTSSLLKVK